MRGTILTPNELWKDFAITEKVKGEECCEYKYGEIVLTGIYIEGQKVGDEQVKIYGTLAHHKNQTDAPAIFMVEDFVDGFNEKLVVDLAKRGYVVLSIDIAGKKENKEHYTIYPESISYANYENVKSDLMHVEETAKETCWYQWTSAGRYALSYLKKLPFIKKTGTLGIGESATVMWQIAGMDKVNCSVFALNAGWHGYRGIEKFGGMTEPQFSDSMYKFIAGIEPEAYAMHITKPTLMLCATNSEKFDCDRVYDTLLRINDDVYTAVHYSTGHRYRVSHDAYKDALIFFEEILVAGRTGKSLSKDVDISCDIVDGKAVFEVSCKRAELSKVEVNVCEQVTNSSIRYWQKLTIYEESRNKFLFRYTPYSEAGIITAYATATYENGFENGSKIIAKKFKPEEVNASFKKNIIYSSRERNSDSIFSIYEDEGKLSQIIVGAEKQVVVKKGPMEIDGVTSKQGLITFCMSSNKFHPGEDAILMMDVYLKESGTFTVKLITDYNENRVEYMANVQIVGGDVWHNIKIEKNKFKTAEGMPLKSYAQVGAIAFISEEEYLINNVLWI